MRCVLFGRPCEVHKQLLGLLFTFFRHFATEFTNANLMSSIFLGIPIWAVSWHGGNGHPECDRENAAIIHDEDWVLCLFYDTLGVHVVKSKRVFSRAEGNSLILTDCLRKRGRNLQIAKKNMQQQKWQGQTD